MSLKHDIQRRWKRRHSTYLYSFKHGILTVFLPNNKKATYRYFITDTPRETSITINNITYPCSINKQYREHELKIVKSRAGSPVYLDLML